MGLFKTKPPETFPATMILVGQGREETLKAVCKHRARDDYFAMIERATKGEVSPEQVVMDLLASWEADEELSADTLRQMDNDRPGIVWAIITAYGKALGVALKGN